LNLWISHLYIILTIIFYIKCEISNQPHICHNNVSQLFLIFFFVTTIDPT